MKLRGSATTPRSTLMLLAPLWVGIAACGAPQAEAPTDAALVPAEVRARVDRAIATTGDVLTYRVEVERDPAVQARVPEAGADIAGFRIVEVSEEHAERPDGRVVDTRAYTLRADLVGSYVLPPVAIEVLPPDEETWSTLETSAIFVEVESVLPADGTATDIRDLKALAPRPPSGWLPWALGGGAALAALALAGLVWRRWGRRLLAPAPPLRPHELAFRALDRLRGTDFADLSAVRSYYFDISAVLRAYVEGRFGLPATDLTSEEIRERMDTLGLGPDQRGQLSAFLSATDEVKYAARRPDEADITGVYEAAVGFVEATVPSDGDGDDDDADEVLPVGAEGPP